MYELFRTRPPIALRLQRVYGRHLANTIERP